MNFFKNNKKSGFTLAEISIAVLIVAVLVALCGLVVKEQLRKSSEYSYYLAYRTVEKLAGQIAALPDTIASTEQASKNLAKANKYNDFEHFVVKNTVLAKTKIKSKWSLLAAKFAYSEAYVFYRLFPKSYANTSTTTYPLFSKEDIDDYLLRLKVCGGEQIVNPDKEPIENPDGTTSDQYYTKDDFYEHGENGEEDYDGCAEENLSTEVLGFFSNNNCNFPEEQAPSITNAIRNGSLTFESLCGDKVDAYCTTSPAGSNDTYSVTIENETDEDGITESTCKLIKTTYINSSGGSGPSFDYDREPVSTNACGVANGYYNMINDAPKEDGDKQYFVNCVCRAGYSLSANNEKVCCQDLNDLKNQYAKNNTTDQDTICKACANDFDELYNSCCPDYSVYTGINDTTNLTGCSCVEGYKMKFSNEGHPFCDRIGCSQGSTYDPERKVCITKPPILSGENFCKSIVKYWNVESSSCGGFTSEGTIHYNKAVFDAATGNNNKYLSVNSKDGAFAKLKPNVVLSNGLRLWVLGDKSASIPGLSYNPSNVTPAQNVCMRLEGKSTILDCQDATGGKGYFCKNENNCYNLNDRSLTVGKMTDARNCCASLDLTNIAIKDEANYEKQNVAFAVSGFTVFVDIDGNKGSGTLWDDVFPFFVGANGTVYPGYPLDGVKKENTTAVSLYVGGNDASSLPTDVYYFDGNNRRKVLAYQSVSYARAACLSRSISEYTPYCLNLGLRFNEKDENPCDKRRCFVGVRNKLRFF